MIASKLVISPELLSQRMSGRDRVKMRKENILKLIKSVPAGTPITIREFSRVTLLSSGNVYQMLKRLMALGIISRYSAEGYVNRYTWSVNDAKVVVPRAELPVVAAPVQQPKADEGYLTSLEDVELNIIRDALKAAKTTPPTEGGSIVLKAGNYYIDRLIDKLDRERANHDHRTTN